MSVIICGGSLLSLTFFKIDLSNKILGIKQSEWEEINKLVPFNSTYQMLYIYSLQVLYSLPSITVDCHKRDSIITTQNSPVFTTLIMTCISIYQKGKNIKCEQSNLKIPIFVHICYYNLFMNIID